MTKFLKNVILLISGTLVAYGSGEGNLHKLPTIDGEQFQKLLLNGEVCSEKLKLSLDKKNGAL